MEALASTSVTRLEGPQFNEDQDDDQPMSSPELESVTPGVPPEVNKTPLGEWSLDHRPVGVSFGLAPLGRGLWLRSDALLADHAQAACWRCR
jgi:hypothetical protein